MTKLVREKSILCFGGETQSVGALIKQGEVEGHENVVSGTKLRWVDRPTATTDAQRKATSEFPEKMTNRCRAVLRNLICVSDSEKDDPSDLLARWVRVMKPKRAEWLLAIKYLKKLQHPLVFKVTEFALLEESFEANIRDYTKLIDAYSEANLLEEAEHTFETMKRRGFQCDSVVLTVLIHMYSKVACLHRAQEAFDEIRLQNMPLDKRACGAMIMAYIRAGKAELGERLLREMESLGVFPGKEIYKALLRSYSRYGNSDGAQRVFDAIQFAGTVPDIRICALLFNAYCVSGQIDKANLVLKNLKKIGLRPNDMCISVLLNAYEKENDLHKALAFLAELEKDGVTVGPQPMATLVAWFTRLGVSKEVQHMLKEIGDSQVVCTNL
ncbi:unnamed protein product [Victoria cruziana]